MKKHVNILLFVIFLKIGNIELNTTKTKESYLKLTTIRCESDENYMKLTECRIKAISRTKGVLYVNITLRKPITKVTLTQEVLRWHTTQYKPFPINVKFEVCGLLQTDENTLMGNTKTMLFQMAYKAMENYTNANHPCPYQEKFVYLRNWAPDYSPILDLIPSGDYKNVYRFIIDGKSRFAMNVTNQLRNNNAF